MKPDAIVVGGGVIGCSIALRLAKAGLKVTVLERGRIGREASWAAAGMLAPQSETTGEEAIFDLSVRSRALYRGFVDEVRSISGIDPEYRGEGMLCVALNDEDASSFAVWPSAQRRLGLSAETLSADDTRRLESSVADSSLGGVFLPNDHQLDSRKLMDSLAAAIGKLGVEVVEGNEVSEIVREGNKVTGVSGAGECLHAGAVIVATGCWSSRLLSTAELEIDVIPARGQMLAVDGGGLRMERVLHSRRVYVVPRRDGRILIGATLEYEGYSRKVTAGAMNRLLSAAIELAPAIAGCEVVETWCGLRPDTPDHLPVIGPGPLENLFIATGHFRNGILLAPLTAEVITGMIVKGAIPDEIRPFGWERFTSA